MARTTVIRTQRTRGPRLAAWLLGLLAMGCHDGYDIFIRLQAHHVSLDIVDADCPCVSERRLPVGTCRQFDDGEDEVPRGCECASPCPGKRARVLVNGVTTYNGGTVGIPWREGAHLTLTACDEVFEIDLPHEFPEAPTITWIDADRVPSTIEWINGAGTASVFVMAIDGFEGEMCRFPGDLTRAVLEGRGELQLTAEGPRIERSVGSARMFITPMTRAANP